MRGYIIVNHECGTAQPCLFNTFIVHVQNKLKPNTKHYYSEMNSRRKRLDVNNSYLASQFKTYQNLWVCFIEFISRENNIEFNIWNIESEMWVLLVQRDHISSVNPVWYCSFIVLTIHWMLSFLELDTYPLSGWVDWVELVVTEVT